MVSETEAQNLNLNDVVNEIENTMADAGVLLKNPRKRIKKEEKTENISVEEQKVVEKDEKVSETPENELDTDEKKALRMGWTPKNQYKGDPENYIDAKEFIGRANLYDKIHNQNEKIKKLEKATDLLTDINKRQHEMIHKDRLDWFKAQKKAAIEINNPDEVDKYDNLIKDEETEINRYKESVQEKPNNEPLPEAKEWAEKNKAWFNRSSEENERMMRYAIMYENELMHKYPSMSINERLTKTEDEIKTVFSSRFENPNRSRPSPVNIGAKENLSSKRSAPKKYSLDDVPAQYRQSIISLARQCKLSIGDYVQQLYETGVIKDE